jgi:hypothetical protein
MLVDRRQTSQLINTSIATVIRLEKAGRLLAIKLGGTRSKTHYRIGQVEGLVPW